MVGWLRSWKLLAGDQAHEFVICALLLICIILFVSTPVSGLCQNDILWRRLGRHLVKFRECQDPGDDAASAGARNSALTLRNFVAQVSRRLGRLADVALFLFWAPLLSLEAEKNHITDQSVSS